MSDEDTVDVNEFLYYLQGLREAMLAGNKDPDFKVTVELTEEHLGVVGYSLGYVKLAETVMKNPGGERVMELIGETSMLIGDAMEDSHPEVDWDAGSEALDKRYQQHRNARNN